jgi:hypothetical protein
VTDLQIRRLLEQRDRAEQQLRMIDARIATARRDYADRNGLISPPRIETLRLAVSS